MPVRRVLAQSLPVQASSEQLAPFVRPIKEPFNLAAQRALSRHHKALIEVFIPADMYHQQPRQALPECGPDLMREMFSRIIALFGYLSNIMKTPREAVVTSADAEYETEPDPSAPASTHGDDLTINGQRDASANGSGPGVKPESPASKE